MTRESSALPEQVIDEGSDWFVTLRDPSVTAQKRAAFVEWLTVSPQHVRAYLEVAALWGEAAHLPDELKVDLGEAMDAHNVVPLRAASPVEAQRETPKCSAGLRIWYAVAACVAVALIGWLVLRSPVLTTGVGEQRLVTLEDGSTVRLNARSKVSLHFSAQVRELDLLEGQALFEVAKDADRPFIVRSKGVQVRAVGTVFDMNSREQATVVTVVEGRVTVDAPAATRRTVKLDALELQAGQQATVDDAGSIDFNPVANLSAATSWLHNLLVFEGTPLRIVVEELNRYSRRPILLDDASLGELRINAVLQSGNPDALLRYLMRLEGVKVEAEPSRVRILRSQVPTSVGATLLPSED